MWIAEPEEWDGLRQELIDLRARVASLPMMPAVATDAEVEEQAAILGGLRPCPICGVTLIGPGLVECSMCAGAEDAAAKRQADQ